MKGRERRDVGRTGLNDGLGVETEEEEEDGADEWKGIKIGWRVKINVSSSKYQDASSLEMDLSHFGRSS